MGNHYRAYHEVATHKLLTQTQYVFIIGDAQVGTYLILLYIFSADNDDNLHLVSQLCKHAKLRVGLEAWEYTAGMMVIEEFATQLQIKFAVKLCNTLSYVL